MLCFAHSEFPQYIRRLLQSNHLPRLRFLCLNFFAHEQLNTETWNLPRLETVMFSYHGDEPRGVDLSRMTRLKHVDISTNSEKYIRPLRYQVAVAFGEEPSLLRM